MTDTKRHSNIVNVNDIEAGAGISAGTKIGYHGKRLGHTAGSQGLGCSWLELAPGKAAFPFHFHCANEEAIYVLEGAGTVRIGEERVPIRAGDYIAFPPGPAHAHQMINTSDAPLRYLCFSTMIRTEVAVYPDSQKVGAMAIGADGTLWVRQLHHESSQKGYFDGEPVD
jgi:uncharacterized cupin superfamily protein